MEYNKPSLTFSEQAELLLSRGLIADKQELVDCLTHLNYYRLSAYLYPYRNFDNSFQSGTTLILVLKHYEFDRQLRFMVMDAIERIEVSIRTQLAYHFTHQYGPFGYTNKNNLPKMDEEKFTKWLTEIQYETDRSSETFVDHFQKQYGDLHHDMPLWMLVEVLSFGKTLTLFNGVQDDIRRIIAKNYCVEDSVLASWLKTINIIRNICAHHGRLWNRELGVKPFIPRQQKNPRWHEPFSIKNNRMFAVLTILQYLITIIAPKIDWQIHFTNLLEQNPEVSTIPMGFDDKWKEHFVWQKSY